jgi:hypothetical protein
MTTVTLNAVIKRINRKLRPDLEALKRTRSARAQLELGDYYVIDYRGNLILDKDVDPEEYGRDLGVVGDWERVA